MSYLSEQREKEQIKVTEHEEGGQRPASGWYRGENPTLKTNKSAITNYR